MNLELGILSGCDESQEWLLPWWYQNLRRYHPYLPIAFCDFGMTEEGRTWCEERGILIPRINPADFPFQKKAEPGWLYEGKRWVQDIPYLSDRKKVFLYFQKPIFMKRSPFERTLWLDLDCQILKPLDTLLAFKMPETKMAVRSSTVFYMVNVERSDALLLEAFNSGVILFEKNSSLLDLWVSLLNQDLESFETDDNLLSFAIFANKVPLLRLAPEYNWEFRWGNNPDATIVHWLKEAGKNALFLLSNNLR